MVILGISAFYHDSAISIIKDGQILFAAQEERYSRIKHDPSFPKLSLLAGLAHLKLNAQDIDSIVYYEKPFLKFERLLETYLAFAPIGFVSFVKAMPIWLKEKIFQKNKIIDELVRCGFDKSKIKKKLYFSDHHLSHAASAFYASPFSEAIVLTMDGVGEWATTTVYTGKNNTLIKNKHIKFPHSLGLLYSAFTYYCGFKVNSGEYKLMGLAPYGRPIYSDLIKKHLIDIKPDGSFRLNMKYFNYCVGLKMTNKKFDQIFNLSFRKPNQELKQVHMDLAASIQFVLEEIIIRICKSLKADLNSDNLCLAGGVALNCVANTALAGEKIFKNIWVQPAAGDAGGSLGAALALQYHLDSSLNRPGAQDMMSGAYLGDEFSDEEIVIHMTQAGAIFKKFSEDELIDRVSNALIQNFAVGWFQGRMEFGPRALGNRSILANPQSAEMQKQLNLKIKFRESFRPFAPAVLEEHVSDWFETDQRSPYMLFVANLIKSKRLNISESQSKLFGLDLLNIPKSVIPAVTHIDFSARLQTVSKSTNLKFHNLISEFYRKTGVPILVNTSFNVRGEPIVASPTDAFKCFMGTDLDMLVVGDYILFKDEQNQKLKNNYKDEFTLD
jgi:carbamoyltransferase